MLLENNYSLGKVMRINVLGYGLMAKQIAALLSMGDFNITIWNYKKIDMGEVNRQVRLLGRSIASQNRGQIGCVDSLDDLEDNLTIETVIENLEVKKSLYDRLKGKITKGYYTNTSSFSPGEIGKTVNGLHFFNPITLKFVEYYEAQKNHDDIKTLFSYLESLDFEVVSVKDNRGYIGNFILFHEISSALKLVEKFNYSIDSVNAFYRRLYDGRDIFNIIDVIGIDVVRAIIVNLKTQDDSIYLPESLAKAIDNNIFGKKNKTSIKQVLI